MANEKYALLDTDFISKTHLICKDEQNRLIDKIVEMPHYIFYCHKQVRAELMRHHTAGALEWLDEKIAAQFICLYDDEKIIDMLGDIYGLSAPLVYTQMLKSACDAYREGYFEEKFVGLSKLQVVEISRNIFLEKLEMDCAAIGEGQNLGELKSYILLQVLRIKFGQKIYVFCSDDKNARNGIVNIGGARCISVLSSFLRLRKEIGFTREEAEPYIKSYLSGCLAKNQTTFRVQDASKERRMRKVPCEQVLDELFSGKLEELKTGNLRYVQ